MLFPRPASWGKFVPCAGELAGSESALDMRAPGNRSTAEESEPSTTWSKLGGLLPDGFYPRVAIPGVANERHTPPYSPASQVALPGFRCPAFSDLFSQICFPRSLLSDRLIGVFQQGLD